LWQIWIDYKTKAKLTVTELAWVTANPPGTKNFSMAPYTQQKKESEMRFHDMKTGTLQKN